MTQNTVIADTLDKPFDIQLTKTQYIHWSPIWNTSRNTLRLATAINPFHEFQCWRLLYVQEWRCDLCRTYFPSSVNSLKCNCSPTFIKFIENQMCHNWYLSVYLCTLICPHRITITKMVNSWKKADKHEKHTSLTEISNRELLVRNHFCVVQWRKIHWYYAKKYPNNSG